MRTGLHGRFAGVGQTAFVSQRLSGWQSGMSGLEDSARNIPESLRIR
jgi:hypothetical protein